MKKSLLPSISTSALVLGLTFQPSCAMETNQSSTLSIKLELTNNAKQNIIGKIVSEKIFTNQNPQKIVKTPHVSIGFVQGLPDKQTANQIGTHSVIFINDYLLNNPINFEVLNCENLGKHTIITPSIVSENGLQALNVALNNELQSHFGITLNSLTIPGNYKPHLTLKNDSTGPNRLSVINTHIDGMRKNGRLYFKLDSSSYSVR